MPVSRQTPSYEGLQPASATQSRVHAQASKKADTKCEQIMRSTLWRMGFRFRKNVGSLPGKPDVFFQRERVAVFCDGDFWHGKNWVARKARLQNGTNSNYWIAKIESNMARDRRHDEDLKSRGIIVLRYWESDVSKSPITISMMVAEVVLSERPSRVSCFSSAAVGSGRNKGGLRCAPSRP